MNFDEETVLLSCEPNLSLSFVLLTYSVKEDPNRFPHIISEASCRYTVCLDSTGKNLNYAMNSVPIQQEIMVLKRKHIGCKQSYWLEKQVITVGCTCAFPTSNAYQKKVF